MKVRQIPADFCKLRFLSLERPEQTVQIVTFDHFHGQNNVQQQQRIVKIFATYHKVREYCFTLSALSITLKLLMEAPRLSCLSINYLELSCHFHLIEHIKPSQQQQICFTSKVTHRLTIH